MTRRLLLFALPIAVVLALAIAWGLWPRTAITAENATRIQPGMTLAEVEEILGGPAGYYNSPDDVPVIVNEALYRLLDGCETKEWHGRRCWILVSFDKQGRGREACINPCIPAPETFLGKINSWLSVAAF
jgi:hypothetical protein